MASRPEIGASEARIRERCLVLAHAGLVAPMMPPDPGAESADDCEWWELTGAGAEYLAGDLDATHHRPPPKVRRDRGGGRPAMPRI
jgi:hypothetical protein